MYFAKVTQTYSAANKLHACVQQLIKLYNRYTFEDAEAIKFKRDIIKVIAKLNAEHPRCKPVTPEWYSSGNEGDYSLSFVCDSVICFTLYKVKGVYDEK